MATRDILLIASFIVLLTLIFSSSIVSGIANSTLKFKQGADDGCFLDVKQEKMTMTQFQSPNCQNLVIVFALNAIIATILTLYTAYLLFLKKPRTKVLFTTAIVLAGLASIASFIFAAVFNIGINNSTEAYFGSLDNVFKSYQKDITLVKPGIGAAWWSTGFFIVYTILEIVGYWKFESAADATATTTTTNVFKA